MKAICPTTSPLLRASNLPFADHVHRFTADDGAQRPLLGPKPQTRRDPLLDETVIRFQDIV
jgi:hypothetical protein